MSVLKWDLTEAALKRTDCPCIMCQVGHSKNNQKVDVSEFTQVMYEEAKKEESLCPKCFNLKLSGQLHKCSPKKETVANLQQRLPQKIQEQLSAKVIKDKVIASGSKEAKLSTGGTPMQVSLGTQLADKKSFTHEDMINMKRDMSLSDRKTLKMAKHIRDGT